MFQDSMEIQARTMPLVSGSWEHTSHSSELILISIILTESLGNNHQECLELSEMQLKIDMI
jgi:hypothetical protein